MNVCVIGLGKIGLPLAAQYASKKANVIGCDINQDVVDSINSGVAHINEEPGLREKVRDAVDCGFLKATTDTKGAVSESDVVVVIVPLVVDEDANIDYSIVDAVTRVVSSGLRKGTLVVYETTLPVGTTRNRFAPMLEKSGLRCGEDFHLVFSPERVSSGVMFEYLRDIPKIVGGADDASTRRGVEFYESVLDSRVIPVSSLEAAEATKLFGMVYRDINIAIANEFARFCNSSGLDVNEIISSSNTNPHSHILLPGIGVGGHCAPVYPYFLIENAKKLGVDLSVSRLARKVNDAMPGFAADIAAEALGGLEGRTVLVLGLAYRGGVKETFLTPSIPLMERLNVAGAKACINDPLFSDDEIRGFGFEPASLNGLGQVDALILSSYHPEYAEIDFNEMKKKGLKAVIDGRNQLPSEDIKALGIAYRGIGKP